MLLFIYFLPSEWGGGLQPAALSLWWILQQVFLINTEFNKWSTLGDVAKVIHLSWSGEVAKIKKKDIFQCLLQWRVSQTAEWSMVIVWSLYLFFCQARPGLSHQIIPVNDRQLSVFSWTSWGSQCGNRKWGLMGRSSFRWSLAASQALGYSGDRGSNLWRTRNHGTFIGTIFTMATLSGDSC